MSSLGWLDIHGHFSAPPTNEVEHQAMIRRARESAFMMTEDWTWSIQDTITSLNASGVQMQMLSNLPVSVEKLKESNDYLAQQVRSFPNRFGLLAALPTDDTESCLAEIARSRTELQADGFAVTTVRNGVDLSSPSLDTVWAKLNSLKAVVFVHPNAYMASNDGLPTPLIEAPFDTCRTVVKMIYRKTFLRFPHITFILAHCGGALPVISGRLRLLGTQAWVANAETITKQEISEQLKKLWVDVAATAETGIGPAFQMVGGDRIVYGSDCGVPCSTHQTIEENRLAVLDIERQLGLKTNQIGSNGWYLFPAAAKRVRDSLTSGGVGLSS